MDQPEISPFDYGQLAMTVEIMQDAVVVLDETGLIDMVNHQLLVATGYTREELVGQSVLILMPPELRERRAAQVTECLNEPVARAFGQGMEGAVVRKDSSSFNAQAAQTPIRSTRGPRLVVAIRDVLDLSLDEIRFRGLLESAPDATLILDAAGRIVLSNGRAQHLFGRDRSKLFDQPLGSLFPGWCADVIAKLISGSRVGFLSGLLDDHPAPMPELEALRDDGSVVPVEVSMAPLHTAQTVLLSVAVRDVSERHRLQAEADRVKDSFLATVSHELRTPLTSVLGYAEILQDLGPEHVSPDARFFLDVVARNAQREIRLVDDLLTLVSAHGEGLSIQPTRVDLSKIVLEAVEGAGPAAQAAGLPLAFDGDVSDAHVHGDADRLAQAIDNLISNAIKFSPPGGQVTVQLRTDARNATVTVKDSGPGIPHTDHSRVFERHFRGQHAVESEKPGAGLGLPIVKSIVEAHQGTVGLKSPPDGGALLRITLPLAARTERNRASTPTPLHEVRTAPRQARRQ